MAEPADATIDTNGTEQEPTPGDYYGLLGVGADASLAEIKRAYHREAKRWHPDRFVNADLALYARAGRRMRQITEAYQALSDPAARGIYDASLRGDERPSGFSGVSSSMVGGFRDDVVYGDFDGHASANPNGAGHFFAALAIVVGLALTLGVVKGASEGNAPLLVFLFILVVALAVLAALFSTNSAPARWATNLMEGEPRGFTPQTVRRRTYRAQTDATDATNATNATNATEATDNADNVDESERAFERLVADALVSIPDQFEPYMRNIIVEVEQEPSVETLRQANVPPGYTLLGLYRGVPLDKRGMAETAPDRITIFRGPIERRCGNDPDKIREQVRATTLHELAHHFGIDHDEMPDWVK